MVKNVNSSFKSAKSINKTILLYKHGAKSDVQTTKTWKNWLLTRKQHDFGPFCGNKMPIRQVFHPIALENTHWIDSKYLCPTPVSIMASNTSILNHIANFPAQTLALPPSPAMATFRTLKVLELMGFNFLNGRLHTQSMTDTYALLKSMLNPNGLKLHHFRHFSG